MHKNRRDDDDDDDGDAFTAGVGTVRMVVDSVRPDRGSRHQIKAYSKMLDSKAPFVSLTLTIQVHEGNSPPCYQGDEFDLKFKAAA